MGKTTTLSGEDFTQVREEGGMSVFSITWGEGSKPLLILLSSGIVDGTYHFALLCILYASLAP